MSVRTTKKICLLLLTIFMENLQPKQGCQSPGLSPRLRLLKFQARPKPTSSLCPSWAWFGFEQAGLSGPRAWGPGQPITISETCKWLNDFCSHWIFARYHLCQRSPNYSYFTPIGTVRMLQSWNLEAVTAQRLHLHGKALYVQELI